MIVKRDCKRLEHTYELQGLPKEKCEELIMIGSSRVVLRYPMECLVATITDHDGHTSILTTISLSHKSKAMLAVGSKSVSFVLATEQEVLAYNHSSELMHSEKVQDRESQECPGWQFMYFPASQLLLLHTPYQSGESAVQVIAGPFSGKHLPVRFQRMAGHNYNPQGILRVDSSSKFAYGSHIFEAKKLSDPPIDFSNRRKVADEQEIIQGVYMLSSQEHFLLCYNFKRESTLNRLSEIAEARGKKERVIYTSRYLIDLLEFVDTTRNIIAVSYLYDEEGCQSMLLVLNHSTSEVLQCFRTNFSTLQVTPDYKLAYNTSGRGRKLKLTVRRLWNKTSLYMSLLGKAESTKKYGDLLYRQVLLLLEDKQ